MARNQTMQGPSFPNPHLDLKTNNTEGSKYLKLKSKFNNCFRDRDKDSASWTTNIGQSPCFWNEDGTVHPG